MANKHRNKEINMNGWMVFLIIALVMGVIVSNLLLLKQSAKMKIPESVLKSIATKKQAEQLAKNTAVNKKKPTEE